MSKFLILLKINIKLLFRNKGFLFFLCVTPIVTAIILSLQINTTISDDQLSVMNIIELSSPEKKALYEGNTTSFIIKVYDGAHTDMSEYILEKMVQTGMFSICRCDVSQLSEEEVESQAKKDAFNDRAGTLLYLKPDFDQAVLTGDYENALLTYSVSADKRWELFERELTDLLTQIYSISNTTGATGKDILQILETVDENLPRKQIINVGNKNNITLTEDQENRKSMIGYALAIITMGFLFCGVCIAHTVIEEQSNKVYTRVMLTKLNRQEYFLVKGAVALCISIVQTGILGICIFVVKSMDFGINKFLFLLIILCIGFLFSILSLIMGVLIGDVMSSNYATFAFWSISGLLSGMYFPLKDTSATLQAISNLMPQKWFLNTSELFLIGDKGACSMLLCVTVAYLVMIISIGSIGLKMKRSDF